MKIYFPYTGPEMPSILMSQIGRELGFNVDIEHLGRPKLRVAAPGVKGIPHQSYHVRLFPISDRFRKFSDNGRRINGVCWHGHYEFMVRVFQSNDFATIRASIAQYLGEKDFLAQTSHGESQDHLFNRNATCKCKND